MRTSKQAVAFMFNHGVEYLAHPWYAQLPLSIFAGAFICVGAALSALLSVGVTFEGLRNLLTGLGFVAGFSMVIISNSALFTEINVILPLTVYMRFKARRGHASIWAHCSAIARFWLVCYVGNVIGALLMASMLGFSQILAEGNGWIRLDEIVASKLKFHTTLGWIQAFVSAAVGNWLVGLAAFLASHAETVPAKVAAVYFPVTSFVVLGVQHSPANMGYFALGLMRTDGEQLGTYLWKAFYWNLIPASLGNMAGAAVFVALAYYVIYAVPHIEQRDEAFLQDLNGDYQDVIERLENSSTGKAGRKTGTTNVNATLENGVAIAEDIV